MSHLTSVGHAELRLENGLDFVIRAGTDPWREVKLPDQKRSPQIPNQFETMRTDFARGVH